MLKELKERNVVAILPNQCKWNEYEKKLEVYGEGWRGYIPLEEIGLDKKTIRKMTDLIIPIARLFEKLFYVCPLKEENDGVFLLSHKKFLEIARELLQIGEIYTFKVDAVCEWGIFGNVSGVTMLVHEIEYSACHFNDLRNIVKPGDVFPVRILSKEIKAGEIWISASRKQVEYSICNRKDIVKVKIGSREPRNEGFFCEVTPDVAGIIDVPADYMKQYNEGDEIIAIITGENQRGYKLDSMISYLLRERNG